MNIIHVHRCPVTNSQDMETTNMPRTDEQIRKMWFLNTAGFYSTVMKHKIMKFKIK